MSPTAHVWQVVFGWGGTSGGAGFTNLYYEAVAGTGSEAQSAVNKAHTLFQGVGAYLPNQIVVTPHTDVRLIEDSTGDLVNIFTVTGVAPVQGSGGSSGGWGGASGACVDWLTGVIHGKHLMVGRTFFVPMVGTVYDAGTITSQGVIDIGLAAEGMRTAAGPAFGVWGRPRKAHTKPDGTVVPALTGLFARAISSRVPDKAVVLRSRRN